jgi:transposase
VTPAASGGARPGRRTRAACLQGWGISGKRQHLLALEDWLTANTAVEAGDQPALHSFARGMRRDQQAVTAGLALPYNSGALEGKNCKIKYLKRLMYGRANFDLLRKMALLN